MTYFQQQFRDSAFAGLSLEGFDARREQARTGLVALRDGGQLPLLHLPGTRGDFNAFQAVAGDLRARVRDLVICGTGGSSLGAQTLYALADQRFGPADGLPRQHFMDNVDPTTFAALTRRLDPATTACLIVSKSGSTAETLSGFVTLLSWARSQLSDDQLPQHFIVITEPRRSPIRDLARRFGLTTLDHDPQVGGRFSVISLVGLLPALAAGLDIGAFRTGAAAMLADALASDHSLAMDGAVYAVAQAEAGRGTSVLMPYCDRLADFGLWYRQLWAESLGKDGKGSTPVRAVGTVDQHSQLQLYKSGPDDKFYTVITVDNPPSPVFDDSLLSDPSLAYLRGRNLSDLMACEARASIETLVNSGRPMRTLQLARLDMASLGALMMHFMLETILAAQLMGVDAFDQPAVEESKILTRQYMTALNSQA